MLETQKKLTIAIPTYNRANYLEILLYSILVQYDGIKEFLELIISDNASTDNTKDVVDQFILRGLDINYVRQKINLGPDVNIANCFRFSSGEYVWIMGDDEYFGDNVLKFILDRLSESKYGLVYVESFSYQDTHAFFNVDNDNIKLKEYARTKFVRRVNVKFGFISGNIINKNIFLQYFDTSLTGKYLGTYFVQLSWTYSVLLVSSSFLYIKTPMLSSKSDNSGEYKLFNAVVVGMRTVGSDIFKNSKYLSIIDKGTIVHWLPYRLEQYQSKALKNGNSRAKFIEETNVSELLQSTYSNYILYWVIIVPILQLPILIAKMWRKYVCGTIRRVDVLLNGIFLL